MTRQAYLDAAQVAVDLIAEPAVAAAWERPSALAKMSVAGLAGHLARQVTRVVDEVDAPVADGVRITLLDHYARAAWLAQDIDNEVNTGIRQRSEKEAAEGVEALLVHTRDALGRLRATLPAQPANRLVTVPAGALPLDDFLTTRLLEISVHVDDLAVSVGVDTPPLPPQVTEHVLDLLCRLAVRRHGVTAVLRALSRAERAPATISAL